jgi:hypothetical protein
MPGDIPFRAAASFVGIEGRRRDGVVVAAVVVRADDFAA